MYAIIDCDNCYVSCERVFRPDLEGKVVGVQTATSAADMLEDSQADLAATFADLKVYETYTIAYNDLKAGAIDAIAIDMTAGAFLIGNDQ